jgi:hypothetical protein
MPSRTRPRTTSPPRTCGRSIKRRPFAAPTSEQLAELVELELPDLAPERAERARKRPEAWRATAARYDSEPATNEGRKELAARAKAAEEVRDRALAADNMFDYGSALLQLGIVVASASIVVAIPWLAWLGGGFGLLAVGFALLGWFAPTLIAF